MYILSANFISKNINRVFITEEDAASGLTRLDTGNYLPVATKLGIPTGAPQKTSQEIPSQTAAGGETSTGSTEASAPLNKALLKIAVYNGTNTAGLAGSLKKLLETAGFVVTETGNKKKESELTIIKIKESKKSALSELQNALKGHYAIGDSLTLDEDDAFDVVIVIGGK
ncbi:MAG: LytR C-terminal domain-containing protein [Candidatus Yonathbacteria bacterium]|nr:LytR C-terminal domain-containing protein [Candidatus Yonathbacteria bacterium]